MSLIHSLFLLAAAVAAMLALLLAAEPLESLHGRPNLLKQRDPPIPLSLGFLHFLARILTGLLPGDRQGLDPSQLGRHTIVQRATRTETDRPTLCEVRRDPVLGLANETLCAGHLVLTCSKLSAPKLEDAFQAKSEASHRSASSTD